MSTPVDIANLALAHLGESATVSSIDPPEGSAQATHLARFYPIARDCMQKAYPWEFCTKRTTPATLDSESSAYLYAYAIPNNALQVFSVLPPEADDDYVAQFNLSALTYSPIPELAAQQSSTRVPQNFTRETLDDGQQVIYTDVKNAVIRYSIRVTDSARFDPLFVMALSRLLASYVAGPVIKGQRGRDESKHQYQMFLAELGIARTADANQSRQYINHVPSWIAAR